MKKYIRFEKYVWGGSAGGRACAGFKYQWSEERGEMYSVANPEQAKDIMLQLREGKRIDFSYLSHFDDTHVDLLSCAADRDLLGPSCNAAIVECLLEVTFWHWEFRNIALVALFVRRLNSLYGMSTGSIVEYVCANTSHNGCAIRKAIIEHLNSGGEAPEREGSSGST